MIVIMVMVMIVKMLSDGCKAISHAVDYMEEWIISI
jgi:hypothetical protein